MPTDAQRLELVEAGLQRVWDVLAAEEGLSTGVVGLRGDVQALRDVVEQVRQNRVELRVVGDGLRVVRETAATARRSAGRWLAVLAVVVVLGILGTVVTGWWAHTARLAATQVLLIARAQCADRDAGLREAVARETTLAGTDPTPGSRAAHRRSATVYAGQIRDCDRVYPIPGR